MFRQSARGTAVWLAIVGVALVLALLAGEVPAGIGAALLAGYLGLALLVARNVGFGAMFSSLPTPATRVAQATEVAREATARARTYPNYDAVVRLLDIGLIVDEQRPDGFSLRRGRFISLDDDGIRPFAIIDVPEGLAGRLGQVRFELRDESNRLQYVYEAEKWLQAGENALLPDYRLPIRRKSAELNAGGWTAQVMVDGGLVGVHPFNLGPSLAARRSEIGADGEILRERVWRSDPADESLPLSLEELLRHQGRMQQKRS